MKTEGAVRHKLQQAGYRHLKRVIRRRLSRRPENCENNLVAGPFSRGETFRVCGLRPAGAPLSPCDEAHGGLEKAAGCPYFKPTATEQGVREEFRTFLRDAPFGEVALLYPDLAALRWVLGGEGVSVEDPHEDPPASDPALEPPAALEPPQDHPRRLPILFGEPEAPQVTPPQRGYRFTVLNGPNLSRLPGGGRGPDE